MPRKIYVSLSGGCYQDTRNVPHGYSIEVLDWDNLLGDEDDAAKEWGRLKTEAKQFVKIKYPYEYHLIQERLARHP